jgi:hypothetical protein
MEEMKQSVTLLVALALFLVLTPVRAQEQADTDCLSADEVQQLFDERKGETWRYTDVTPYALADTCVVKVSPVQVRINGKEYRWVGPKITGHWYRIASIKEERGSVWKDYTTEPREATWIRVVVATGPAGFETPVSVIRFTKPIRIVGLPDYSPRHVVEWVRGLTFVFAIEGLGVIAFIPPCQLAIPRPNN